MENQVAVFEQKNIRRMEHEGETYFSVIDIIEILTDSAAPTKYWSALKSREPQLSTICRKFKFLAPDGKMRPTDCANTEGALRIIQSVPSPKAEPFKMWLAGLGKQAIDEVIDPELGFERLHELYEAKGYSQKWIGNRLKTIDVRKELTDEWQKRGVQDNKDYGILTATIAKGTFGLTPSEHAKHKGLGKENLRDHMTNMELILTAFSEEATRMLAEKDDAQGFEQNHEAAARGGEIAGKARKNLETATGQKVVSAKNYLTTSESNNADSLPENAPPQ